MALVTYMRRLLHHIVRLMKDHRLYELRGLKGRCVEPQTTRRMILKKLQVSPKIRRRLSQRREAS